MTEKYAVFFLLPFEEKTLCIYECDSIIKVELGHKLLRNQEIICLNFDEYIHNLTTTYQIPSNLFDVNVAVRILCGFPASKFNEYSPPWKGISCLGKHLSTDGIFPLIKSIENGKFGNYSDWISSLPIGWEKLLIDALKSEHRRLISELKAEGLLTHFLNVEMRLKLIFSEVGVQGINIDNDKLLSKYCSLDTEYYRAVKTLELSHKFIVDLRSRNISFENIKGFLKGFNPEDFSKKYFWESIELMRETSEFLNCLWIEHYNRWDLAELLRISSSISPNCKLEYDIFGTVTGRIILNRPGIQYLKRTSRDIFSPNDGFEFIYADYAQFEPGILASFSYDSKLIELYNSGDVYSGLAKEIGGTCNRKIAKELFLSFVYGMTKENIRRRIVQKFGEQASKASDSFFSQFIFIDKWKIKIIEEVKRNKFAKGPFSYIRRVSSEDTDIDISRWAPNHIIQSTASGIFKKVLCEIASHLKECRMLVPMHDAILLECPKTKSTEIRKQISRIMINCFQETCPGIEARISFDPFSHEN